MSLTNFGIRVVGTDLLFWGSAHLRNFKPWPDRARTYPTKEEAGSTLKYIRETNLRVNKLYPHLEQYPTELEIVRIVTEVLPLEVCG